MIPSLAEDAECLELSCFANSTDILENTLAVSNKVQHTLTQPNTLLLCIYPGEIEKKSLHKDLYKNVNSFFHNGPKL